VGGGLGEGDEFVAALAPYPQLAGLDDPPGLGGRARAAVELDPDPTRQVAPRGALEVDVGGLDLSSDCRPRGYVR